MSKILSIAATVGALVMAATPLLAIGGFAHASETDMQPVHIAVADLSLNRAQDAAEFARRVDHAAYAFCAQTGFSDLTRLNTCRQAIRQEAVQKLAPSQQQDLRSLDRAPASLRLATR